MQTHRLPLPMFTFVFFFVQGKCLAIEIVPIANKSINGPHRLDVQNVRTSPTRDHESLGKDLRWHLQNTTYKPVVSESQLRPIFEVRKTGHIIFHLLLDRAARNSSIGLMMIPLVIFCCAVIICASIADDNGDNEDADLVGPRKGVPVSHKRVSRGFAGEPPSFVDAAAPPGAVGHGYSGAQSPGAAIPYGVQSVGHGYSGPRSGMSSPGSSMHYVFPSPGRTSNLNLPDPICPELLLTVESWYAVEFDRIGHAAGPIHIYGRFKMLLLTAHIQTDSSGLESLKLAMGDGQGSLVGSVTKGERTLIIEDKRGQPYGEISSIGKLSYTLRCSGAEQLTFNVDERNGAIAVVSAHDGTRLASAAKTSDVMHLPSPQAHLGIDVAAGMDPGLTILCILGLIAFDFDR